MKGLKTGQGVTFVYQTLQIKGQEVKIYKKGIIEQTTQTGYVIQIVDDMSLKYMDGTLCNRNEADVEPRSTACDPEDMKPENEIK